MVDEITVLSGHDALHHESY